MAPIYLLFTLSGKLATMDTSGSKRFAVSLAAYLVLTWVFSAVFYLAIIRAGSMLAFHQLFILGLMWSPAAAALVVGLGIERDISWFGWEMARFRTLVASLLIPLLACLAVYPPVWAWFGGPNDAVLSAFMNRLPTNLLPTGPALACYLVAGLGTTCVFALGEEIGWRGFLTPFLARRFDYPANALISGLIWALWHYPLIIFADYNSGASTGYVLFWFTIMIVAFSFIITWLRLISGTLWTAVLFHGSHNFFIQGVFDPLTPHGTPGLYLTTEFGAGLAVVYGLAAVVLWRKYSR